MVLSNWNPKNIVQRILPAAVILTNVSGHAGVVQTSNAKSGRNGTSATLTISVVVVPVVQTSTATTVPPKTNDSISYNFTTRRYERRYEIRTLPSEKAPDSNTVLETLTIVSE